MTNRRSFFGAATAALVGWFGVGKAMASADAPEAKQERKYIQGLFRRGPDGIPYEVDPKFARKGDRWMRWYL